MKKLRWIVLGVGTFFALVFWGIWAPDHPYARGIAVGLIFAGVGWFGYITWRGGQEDARRQRETWDRWAQEGREASERRAQTRETKPPESDH